MAKQYEIDTIITYNNIEKPFLSIKRFEGGKVVNSTELFFTLEQLDENGLPVNVDSLVEKLKEVVGTNSHNVLLLLSCTQVFKSTYLMPNVAQRKLVKLHEETLKNDYTDLDNYQKLSFEYKASFGYIFYDYLVNAKMIEYFQKVCKMVNLTCVEYDLLQNYILKIIKTQVKKDAVLFYKENDVVFLVVSIGNNLSGYSCFLDEQSLYPLEIFKTIDKHFFELEKVQVVDYYCNYECESLEQFDPTIFSLTYFNNIPGTKLL